MNDDYPLFNIESGEYVVKWYFPSNYHTELLQDISPEFIKTIEDEMSSISRRLGIEETPKFSWLKKFGGLDRIVLRSGGRILLEPLEGVYFRDVKDPREALALLSMLSNYFNKLNTLNLPERSIER